LVAHTGQAEADLRRGRRHDALVFGRTADCAVARRAVVPRAGDMADVHRAARRLPRAGRGRQERQAGDVYGRDGHVRGADDADERRGEGARGGELRQRTDVHGHSGPAGQRRLLPEADGGLLRPQSRLRRAGGGYRPERPDAGGDDVRRLRRYGHGRGDADGEEGGGPLGGAAGAAGREVGGMGAAMAGHLLGREAVRLA